MFGVRRLMLIEKLNSAFGDIVFYDAEFSQDIKNKGEIPRVVCFVYKKLGSDKLEKKYGSSIKEIPYPLDTTLFVSFNFVAEAASMLALGMPLPKYGWDCFIENKKLYMGRIPKTPGAFGLLRTAARYKVPDLMSESLKIHFRDMVINNSTYTDKQMNDILDYCGRDVIATEALFLAQLKDIEKHYPNEGPQTLIAQALFHAKSMMYVAKVEHNGIHVDHDLLTKYRDNYPRVRLEMVDAINAKIDVYENTSLNLKKFTNFVKRIGLFSRWPKTETGKLSTTDKILFKFAQQNDQVNEFYLCKEFADSSKLKGFVQGPDRKARASLMMFGTTTGRTNPSTSRYPFNAPAYMRNFIHPMDDHAHVYADYVTQEPGIAAWLSKDQNMIDAYNSPDMYLFAPKQSGVVPADATKASHPKERDLYKTALLATMFGQKERSLADDLNISIDEAAKLLADIYSAYTKFFKFNKRIVSRSLQRGYQVTKFGWRKNLDSGDMINHRSVYNFLCQAHGSEMLRLALIGLTEKNFEVNALIHDGILLHVPLKNLENKIKKIEKIMTDASKVVLGKHSKIRVEFNTMRSHFKQKEKEQNKFNRIMKRVNQGSVRIAGQVCTDNSTPVQSSYTST